MKKVILSLLVGSVLFTSCKKDDKSCDLNATNLAGTYKITSVKYKASALVPEVEVFTNSAWYDACEKDDLTVLNANGTYNYQDAGTVCTPAGDDTGVWALAGNTLTVDGEPGNVASFSCSGMTLTQSNVQATGDLLTITFTKQ